MSIKIGSIRLRRTPKFNVTGTTGKYADDLYEEYKSVYGEPEYHKNDKQV